MLGERFAIQANALNLMRLLLALTVVVHHAGHLIGSSPWPTPAGQLLTNLPVDAFFAISGFLICRSWARRPDIRAFLVARATRLLPGLCGCLLFTAFLLAPVLIDPPMFGQLVYVAGNAATLGGAGLDHSLAGRQLTGGTWNGSLWTLLPEAICYLLVAYLGVSRRLGVRTFVILAIILWTLGLGDIFLPTTDELHPARAIPRVGLMFMCGALLWMLRDRIPVSRWLGLFSLLLLVAGSFTPNYRLVAAPAVAYLCLYVALSLGRWRRSVISNDLSYGVYVYSYPVQQGALLLGFEGSWPSFAVVSVVGTLPLAAASWFLLERPSIRRCSRYTHRVAAGGRAHRVAPLAASAP